jgi:3-hydroxy-9,10-secoandrosta-1,3,5(10)-triene-9,17-dione monooxygenase
LPRDNLTDGLSPSIMVPEPDLTAAEMVRRARELVPWLRERAAGMEQERRISDEVNQRIMAAGIYRVLQPRRFGGYEFDLSTYAEAIAEITRGDASTGWVLSFNAAHTWWAAQLPERGQIEVFGSDGDLRAPIALAPQGIAEPVAGGFRLEGRWDYCSGCDVSNWLGVIAPVAGESKAAAGPEVLLAFLPHGEFRVDDNWQVLGLRATGSKRAVLERVFVPDHRALSFSALTHQYTAPGHAVHANPIYRVPLIPIVCIEVAAIAIGIAAAAIDAFVEHIDSKRLSFPPFTLMKDNRRTQSCLGRASARLEAARAGTEAIIRRQEARVVRLDGGAPFTDVEIRRDLLLLDEVARAAQDCVATVFGAAGTSAARIGHPLERIFRDVSMMLTHRFIDAERTSENFGALSLGFPPYSDL